MNDYITQTISSMNIGDIYIKLLMNDKQTSIIYENVIQMIFALNCSSFPSRTRCQKTKRTHKDMTIVKTLERPEQNTDLSKLINNFI